MFTTDSNFPLGEGSYPKLFCLGINNSPQSNPVPCPAELYSTFEDATGWTLVFEESSASCRRRNNPGMETIPGFGKLKIDDMSTQCPPRRPAHRGKCDALVGVLDKMLDELQRTRYQLIQARAELATQVPVLIREEEAERLVQLLAGLVQTAADSIGFDFGELHLLDEQAEYLEVRCSTRSCPTLDEGRRSLAECPADLDAMSGHAVVIKGPSQMATWKVPFDCQSAVCIPVASLTHVIGTLWLYSSQRQSVSDQELNLIEIIGGRIAAELERESVIRHALNRQPGPGLQSGAGELESVVDAPFDGWNLTGQSGESDGMRLSWCVGDSDQIEIKAETCDDNLCSRVTVDPFTGAIEITNATGLIGVWHIDHKGCLASLSPLRYLLPGQQIFVARKSDFADGHGPLNPASPGAAPERAWLLLSRT